MMTCRVTRDSIVEFPTPDSRRLNGNMSVGAALLSAADRHPGKMAIVSEDRRLTYGQFNARVNRLANALQALGLRKGDHVAVLLGNCIEIVEFLMAAAKNGIVAVPVNFRFVAPEIVYVVNQSRSKALIFGSEFLERVEAAKAQFETVEHLVAVGGPAPTGALDYEALLAGASDAEPGVEVDENDPWYIGYTSGTTGFPKGAVISHRARILPALFMSVEFGLRDTDVELMTMPLFHSNGITFSMTGLYLGNTVVVLKKFDAEEVLRTIDRERCSYASLVPTMYDMILGLPEQTRAKYDVSSMRVLISSSSPLLTKTKEGILEYFRTAELNEFYGSSEGGIVTNLKHRDQKRKIRCVGQAMFGVKVRLLDERGVDVRPGEVGELFSYGPCFTEYYRMPDATRRAFRDGWFSAGDMARMDEEGYFYIVDRISDMINSGGENIYPAEIEEVISRHPAVAELAVIATPDERWGETVAAIVVLRDGASATAEEIIGFCRGRLAGYKHPRSVEFVDALPKTPTGKILKRILKQQRAQAAVE